MVHLHGSIAAELEQEEGTRTAAASGYFPEPESFDGTPAINHLLPKTGSTIFGPGTFGPGLGSD